MTMKKLTTSRKLKEKNVDIMTIKECAELPLAVIELL